LREHKPEAQFPALDAVAEPVGGRGARGRLSRPWERDAEVNRLVQTLLRERASVLLVGDGGVGKSAVLPRPCGRSSASGRPKSDAPGEEDAKLAAAIFGTRARRGGAGLMRMTTRTTATGSATRTRRPAGGGSG
jgi:hypothetical protein